ncbi:hypothetical protein [Ferrovibrio sp.]|uniref:hypothetical protein n=1 Tax=Ferrovibrio sp. TaxID=1917215 RepID=UPI0035AFAB3E
MATAPTTRPAASAAPANPKPAAAPAEAEDRHEPNQPSDLDDLSHAEFRMLFEESGQNILFAKRQQWRVLEYFTLLSLGIVALCALAPVAAGIAHFVAYFLLFAGAAMILTLGMLQVWQFGEARKREELMQGFSSHLRSILGHRGSLSRDIHRFTILLILLLLVVVTDLVAFRILLDLGK